MTASASLTSAISPDKPGHNGYDSCGEPSVGGDDFETMMVKVVDLHAALDFRSH